MTHINLGPLALWSSVFGWTAAARTPTEPASAYVLIRRSACGCFEHGLIGFPKTAPVDQSYYIVQPSDPA